MQATLLGHACTWLLLHGNSMAHTPAPLQKHHPHISPAPASGVLSMARGSDPNSGGSSFSVLLGDAPHLDMQYSIFG